MVSLRKLMGVVVDLASILVPDAVRRRKLNTSQLSTKQKMMTDKVAEILLELSRTSKLDDPSKFTQ